MGQSQSNQQQEQHAPAEPAMTEEERAQAQAEMRARQQAALDRRLADQSKRGTATSSASARPTKKPTALEQMSRENVGYRNMDANSDLRSWN